MTPDPKAILLRMLRRSTQEALASRLGIPRSLISDVVADQREPGPTLLAALGLERVVSYRRVSATRNNGLSK